MEIKKLINFEEIEQVIYIGKIKNERELVEKFIISQNLKEDLFEFLEYLKGNKPDRNISLNIIGNYGTGKSHLLSFLSIILSKPQMIQYIQDDEIREAFETLNKEFCVVKYQLSTSKDLAEIFFYRVQQQLKENYGIEIREIDLETEKKDYGELIEEILHKIKEKDPNKGLIVIFDEYSEFLKTKESYKQNKDLQFTRKVAECSKDQDFILMLSMQEHIFSNPAFKDKADEIKKIEERFLKFNITSENVEDIIAKRIVAKDPNQRQQLKILFDEIKDKFDNLSLEEDKFIDLFPIHPYLIEMFSKLTFFENRSILLFVSDETKKILEKEFPTFVTYDLIFKDLIEKEHTIKNKEMVKPVLDIVKSLRDIVPRLDEQYREMANVLINALAIKNLVTPPDNEGEKRGGDTPEKFAENLFILPKSKLKPSDNIDLILNLLMRNSEGQFISKDGESNTYFINLNKTTDYEQIINNKAANMDDLSYNNEVFVEDFLLNELGFEITNDLRYADNNKKYVLEDTVNWTQRNSFREGVLAINVGNDLLIEDSKDFLLNIKGFKHHTINEFESNQIIVKPAYSEEFRQSMRRLAAVNEFLKTRTHVDVMRSKKRSIIDNEVKKHFKKAMAESTIKYKSNNYTLADLGITTDITSEIFSQIKEKLLGEDLVKEYPEYPKFKSDAVLSKNNIVGTLDNVLKEMGNKSKLTDFDIRSSRILLPLELYKDNSIDVNNSKYASIILEKVESTFKNIDINEFVELFKQKPYGLQKEITYFLIAVLLRNGNIMISNKSGKSFSSSDFKQLFKNGLKAFEDLRYIRQEEGPSADTQKLFDILDLDKTLLEFKKDHPDAFKSYVEKYENILKDISDIKKEFSYVVQSNVINLPLNDLKEKLDIIDEADFKKIEVKSINDFNKIEYSNENLSKIKEGYDLISVLKSFFIDYNNYIKSGIKYMEDALDVIDNDFFKENDKNELNNIYQESLEIIKNSKKLLKYDERRPLEGKIQLFKSKYKSIYYIAHEDYVGKNVNWDYLEEIQQTDEFKKLINLSKVKSINNTEFKQIRAEIWNISSLKCDSFTVDELDSNYRCSCMFPQGLGQYKNINLSINEIGETIPKLYNAWENEILITIQDNKSKLDQLDLKQQDIIDNILINKELPEIIDFDVIQAIDALLEDVEIKEVNLDEIFEVLTSERATLKVDEIMDKFEEYIKNVVSDSDNARIKLIKTNENKEIN